VNFCARHGEKDEFFNKPFWQKDAKL
jgi:hypothetical protein